jgi:tyrosinase
MRVAITVGPGTGTRYLGWSPVPAQVRVTDAAGAAGPLDVIIRNSGAGAGRMSFSAGAPWQPVDELVLTLPLTGQPVAFLVAGEFGRPSTIDGDAVVEAVGADDALLGATPLMVRVRKDATTLTPLERDRFCAALATFNDRGRGRFRDFRNTHTQAGDPEAHGFAGFLPWHRAFLLDLERELQAIDPSVALPYWRFDRPAPSLFSRDFMGVTTAATGAVEFSSTNLLQFWATDSVPGVVRRPQFNTREAPAGVRTEITTLRLGGPGATYTAFRALEGNPHGTAHLSFTGSISSIPTAAKDPLFFLLHANVDRLWAKWQWLAGRFSTNDARTFSPDQTPRVGHRLGDTMWPWNGVTTPPRPPTAPGGTMAPTALVTAPGGMPRVLDMIDYHGVGTPAARLGFDYDDVPFQ